MSSSKLRNAALAVVTLLLLVQLVQPGPPEPGLRGDEPMEAHISVPPDVDSLLRRACYDCHSPDTRWPWYSRISPVSWIITDHVEHGRTDLDFDHWGTDPVREPTPNQRLRWICSDLREGSMPPRSYRVLHPEARLTDEQIDRICAWTERMRQEIR